MFRVVCYRFVTVVISEVIAMHSTDASSSIRKLSAIAAGAAVFLGLRHCRSRLALQKLKGCAAAKHRQAK
jgi:hypothetical protein